MGAGNISINFLGVNVRRLLHFLSVVEAGSMNKAAMAVGLSQPALTRSIQSLEEALGVLLLDRSAKGVVPTMQGQRILAHARALRSDLARAAFEIEELTSDAGRTLRIGVTSGVCWLSTRAIDVILAQSPRLNVKAVEGYTANLLAELELGALDVAVCPSAAVSLGPKTVSRRVFHQRFCLWVNRDHAILEKPHIELRDLTGFKWILPLRESVSSGRLHKAFKAEGAYPEGSFIECSSHLMILEMLTQTNHIAFMSEMAFDVAARAGVVARLNGEFGFAPQVYEAYWLNDAPMEHIDQFLATMQHIALQSGLA